jgi:HAD superfamily hydrolase (TIGR01490 family)
MSTPRPFAVFDIDGTLIRWQLYHAITDELVRTKHLNPQAFEAVREARLTWKKRAHESSYATYEKALIDFYETAVNGLEGEALMQACRTVIEKYKDQVYTYTRDLVRDLKSKNYLLFAISASQDEIVKMLAEYYEFDDAGGSTYEVKSGRYVGMKQLLRKENKPEFLKKLASKHSAGWQGSIAVGDSEGDIAMLSIVEQPIAFNPTKKLFEHARQNGWKVAVERKNMIYELEPENGQYKLKG